MARDHEIFVAALTEDMIGGGIEGMSLNEHCGSDNGEEIFFFFFGLVSWSVFVILKIYFLCSKMGGQGKTTF